MIQANYTTLVGQLQRIDDPRKRRGQCHEWLYLLLVIASALMAGQRSGRAMAEWASAHDDEIQLKYYRLQQISEGSIDLKYGTVDPLKGPTEVGTGSADEEVQLSTLVEKLNERFGTQFTLADQLFFDQVRESAVANEQLRQAAEANTLENFEPVFNKQLENLFSERIDDNEEIFMRLMNDDRFREVAAKHLMRAVYEQITKDAA